MNRNTWNCLIGAAFVLVTGCLYQPPMPLPGTRSLAFQICTPGSVVELSGGWGAPLVRPADGDGNLVINNWPSDRGSLNLVIRGTGLSPYGQVVQTPAGVSIYHVGSCGVVGPLGTGEAQLPALERLWADTGERGRVHVDGDRFVRDDGTTFAWRGFTAFRLYEQWLAGGAAVIDPVVQDWLTCGGGCNARGPNVLRVLGMVDSFAHLWPQEHGDRYYTELAPFVDHLWNTFHLRVEFVVFADAQLIVADSAAQDQHNERVYVALSSSQTPTIFWEQGNEVFKNLPGGGARAYELGRRIQGRSPKILVASGDYDDPTVNQLDYVTLHPPRDAEWPRKAKDVYDFREAAHKPAVGDEPMGFGEVERANARSTSTLDAAHFAAACQLFSAGCTYHSDAGIAFGPLGPIQRATATAFFAAASWVPADAQRMPYRRGGESAGCNWVGGESLVEHDDAQELRTFGKDVDGTGYVVQIRSTRPAPTACPGWRIVETPQPGLVRVTR